MLLTSGCDSAVGGNGEPLLRHRVVASHHSLAKRTAGESMGAPGCHLSAEAGKFCKSGRLRL